jgi:hypothetical protein
MQYEVKVSLRRWIDIGWLLAKQPLFQFASLEAKGFILELICGATGHISRIRKFTPNPTYENSLVMFSSHAFLGLIHLEKDYHVRGTLIGLS